ncbi:MAG: DinB family protein [Intrasporangium sp.]|uniref:DinB family protein n=1 Tax=Intrasporangium sp. TaxID=1925024 RepID=UPI002649B871|nr:DinB family protein [Intrasporangium sp.]MDN5796887.1 DinB family protein [Intrasporangium sp.]
MVPDPDELTDPGPATPDTADWTWVLTRRCPDCGFDPDQVGPPGFASVIREMGQRYAAVLGRDDVARRPSAGVWSPLEYCCHVRDVCDVMRGRLEQILSGDGRRTVRFADWDQDAAAAQERYWRSDPVTVRGELTAALGLAADAFERPHGAQWDWPALRSNGSEFTCHTLGAYFLHDLRHHLWDVRG